MAESRNPGAADLRLACAGLALLGLAACGPPPAPPESGSPNVGGAGPTAPASPVPAEVAALDRRHSAASSTDDMTNALSAALGRGSGPPLPDDLLLGGDCPVVGTEADEEIAAQAAGRVPLKVGLTLTSLWRRNPGEEFECLLQVTEVRRDSIDATLDCNLPSERPAVRRRLCRADLGDARMLMTETGMMTVIDASGEDVPETMVGATWFSLSRREFAELKRTGSVKHRYVQPHAAGNRLDVEATAVLRNDGAGTSRIAINDSVVEVPVIRASGEFSGWYHDRSESGRLTALILDDERFPLLVDYVHLTGADPRMAFRLNYAKISYPEREKGDRDGQMERRLAEERSVDVYGIYFDFNSDRIREESEPILQEIADILGRNSAWTLGIYGHTDNVGGAAYNRDLSRRRSEAVRKALVERYGIAASRLTSAGHGDVAPKDTNDTPEGRARNRRVELIRR